MSLGMQNDHMTSTDWNSDPAFLLRTGLIKWLRQTPTLGGLATALASPGVGETDVATEITKGKFHR